MDCNCSADPYLQQVCDRLEAPLLCIVDGNASGLQATALHADGAVADPSLTASKVMVHSHE
jgi:hypothetical protein